MFAVLSVFVFLGLTVLFSVGASFGAAFCLGALSGSLTTFGVIPARGLFQTVLLPALIFGAGYGFLWLWLGLA